MLFSGPVTTNFVVLALNSTRIQLETWAEIGEEGPWFPPGSRLISSKHA